MCKITIEGAQKALPIIEGRFALVRPFAPYGSVAIGVAFQNLVEVCHIFVSISLLLPFSWPLSNLFCMLEIAYLGRSYSLKFL